jgi:valyl-tRNA synthetase
MDDDYHRAVLEAFVQLYDKGYIYRDHYLVNWDAGTMSAISDLEVRQVELEDEMYEVDYALESGDGHITAATVRPETIVADVAVAVHPEDDRYRALVGQNVRVPLTDRVVPIIADDYVDPAFGTGALKITPGHDPNDFEIGRRHGLDELSAINPDRTMSELAGEFAGLGADEARTAMTDKLDELGLLRSREPYKHSVPHSDRSGVRIEPLISQQWFCNMRELAKPAIAAAESGEVRFIPAGAKSIFDSWMEDLKPWCVSRQLWWGHQLPVWYCTADASHVHVSADGPGSAPCPDCGNGEWRQDEDVLDTWFSSGLWDFATLGWPDRTPELAHFHPTSVLCTARDIINLWVARMMMLSFEFLGEKPFHDVYIHSVIQASDGRRMSKSLGTGIDPLDLIGEYGADATRYGLLNMSSTQDVRFNEGKIGEGRDLANKLWNASRLLVVLGDSSAFKDIVDFDPASAATLADRWIVARLDRVQREATRLIDTYDFAMLVKELYGFVWNELCDWYLESVKSRLRSEDADVRRTATQTLAWVIDRTVRLMHPVMPHVTEEIATQIWGTPDDPTCCVATSMWYASSLERPDQFDDAVAEYESLQRLVTRTRSLRQAVNLPPSSTVEAGVDVSGPYASDIEQLLGDLAGVGSGSGSDGAGIRIGEGAIALTLHGLDASQLRSRIEADLKAAKGEVKRAEGKLANERFTSRAPAELVDEERAKVDRWNREAAQLEDVLAQLG